MATVVNKELNSIVECCICTEIFTEPRMLPCIHTFCVKCLTETGSKAKKGPGDKMPCPLCRTEFTIPTDGFTGLQKNFFVDSLVEVIQLLSKQHVCDSNTGNCSSVKWYCVECKQRLCHECSTVHRRIHSQEHHNLVPFENQTSDKKITDFRTSTFCDKHEREELKIFCNDCHLVLCTFCFLENHQSHKWSEVKEVANKLKTQIENNIGILSSCAPEARSILEQLEKNNIKYLETVSKTESEVIKKKLQVKALLNEIAEENASSLLSRLTSLKRTTSKKKEIEQEEIDRHHTKLDSYIMFCKEFVARGSDVDICCAANELDNKAKDLKELHRTVMEQKSTLSDISFEERNSEDFLKTFGNLLGKIEDVQDIAARCPIETTRPLLPKETTDHTHKMSKNFPPQRFSGFPSIGRRVSSQERSSSQELRRDNSPHGAVQRTSSPLTLPVQVKDTRKEQQPAKELSREIIEHKAGSLFEEYLNLQDLTEAVTCIKELQSPKSLHIFVSLAINYVLEKKELARILTGILFHQLLTEGVLSFEQCELGFKDVLQEAESLAVVIPKVWEYLGEIVAGTIKDKEKMWQLLKTGCQELAPNRRDILFRKTVAVAAHKLGADRTSMALRRSGMRWSDFVNSDLFSYTKQNNLEQLDPVREELIALLKEHSDNQPIFKWIQRNVTPAEAETREFIRALMTAVCTRAIMASETSSNAQSTSYSVSEAEIVSRQTLLQRYLDHKPDREIQALYALQALVHSLEHPSNILHSFFNIFYDKDFIAEEAFWEWQNSTDPAEQTGKGVAFQSVRPFFDWLREGTEETL